MDAISSNSSDGEGSVDNTFRPLEYFSMITNYRNIPHMPHGVSHDMYVRLRASDIAAMKLTHLYSEANCNAHSTQPSGTTEWTGLHGRHILSIAWDWIVLNDGIFRMPPNGITRTNVMLVDEYGYDTDVMATDRVCANKIGTLDWQDVLQKMLQSRGLI